MRLPLARLFKPVDPVVAVHRASRDADSALDLLQRAGFRRSDLTVVGQGDAALDVAQLGSRHAGAAPHWAASGLALGLLWAAFAIVAVLLHATGSAAFVFLVAAGALTLMLQALVMGHVAAPAHGAAPGRPAAAPLAPVGVPPSQVWRFLVVVHGSRADVALARDLLALR